MVMKLDLFSFFWRWSRCSIFVWSRLPAIFNLDVLVICKYRVAFVLELLRDDFFFESSLLWYYVRVFIYTWRNICNFSSSRLFVLFIKRNWLSLFDFLSRIISIQSLLCLYLRRLSISLAPSVLMLGISTWRHIVELIFWLVLLSAHRRGACI